MLGDRSTLYKYLNPHASLIVTIAPKLNQAHLYLLDTVTGGVLYELQLDDVDTAQPVKAHMVENWITATYAVRNADEGLSAHIVTVELYETLLPRLLLIRAPRESLPPGPTSKATLAASLVTAAPNSPLQAALYLLLSPKRSSTREASFTPYPPRQPSLAFR